MKQVAAIGLVAVLLAGCDKPVPVSDLKPPGKWMMAAPCKLPKYPANDGDPLVRVQHETSMRKCAAKRGDQVRGLQSYVRKVVKSSR